MKNYNELPLRSRYLKNNIIFFFYMDYCFNTISIVVFLFYSTHRFDLHEPNINQVVF